MCSRGESLTHHTGQMKLFNTIAAAAGIGASLIATTIPASAQRMWCTKDLLGNTTCRGSDGSSVRMTEDLLGNPSFRGRTSDGSRWNSNCTKDLLGNTTCW